MKDSARLYLAATNEVDQDRMNKAIWAEAMALEQGDAKRAKYTYIQLRVRQFERAINRSGARGEFSEDLQKRRSDQPVHSASVQPVDSSAAADTSLANKATRQFNWGAALLPFLWSLFNTRGWYWAAAVAGTILIPGIGWLVTGIVFGIFGSRWSWASKDWDSFDSFERSQMGWTVGGIVFTVTVLVILGLAGA